MTTLEPRSRKEACLSDLQFDALSAGDLEDAARAAFVAHIADCERCRARSANLDVDAASFLEAHPNPPRREASLKRRTPIPPPSVRPRRKWEGPAFYAVTAFALAAGLLLFLRGAPNETRHDDGVRSKGSDHIGVFIKRGENVTSGADQDIVAPGDALRFSVSNTEPRFVAIFGIDSTSKVSTYYPAEGSRAVRLAPSQNEALPFAVEFDDVLGEEHVVAVFCANETPLSSLRLAIEGNSRHPALPASCTSDHLSLKKEARR